MSTFICNYGLGKNGDRIGLAWDIIEGLKRGLMQNRNCTDPDLKAIQENLILHFIEKAERNLEKLVKINNID